MKCVSLSFVTSRERHVLSENWEDVSLTFFLKFQIETSCLSTEKLHSELIKIMSIFNV